MDQSDSGDNSEIDLGNPPFNIQEIYDLEQTLSADQESGILADQPSRIIRPYQTTLVKIQGIKTKLQRIRNQDNLHGDEALALMETLISIQTITEEEIQVKRELYRAKLIRQTIMKEALDEEEGTGHKIAEIKGLRLAKERIQKLLAEDSEITYKGTNLSKPKIQEISINPPTQEQAAVPERTIQKLKEFYNQMISKKNDRLNCKDSQLLKYKEIKEELIRKKNDIERKKKTIQNDENERVHSERMKNLKEYVRQLRKYIKKNKERILVPSEIRHSLISVD